MFRELLTRARFLFFRKQRSELEEEIQFHLEQAITAKKAMGLPAAEARRLALIEFGGVQAAREKTEQQRPGFSLGTIAQDVRYSLRGIVARRWFSAAVIATLALGIGLNTMVFTLVYTVLYKPVPVPGGERLISISSRKLSQNDQGGPMSYPDFQDFKTQARSMESLEACSDSQGVLSDNGISPQQYHLQRATGGIFSMVGAKALQGRTFQASDALPGAGPVVVISYDVWKEQFAGDTGVIGRRVHVNGAPVTIIGVMPEGFHFPTNVDLWMPLIPTAELGKRDNRTLRAYGIVRRGVSLRQADAELNGIAARLANQFPADKDLGLSVLTFQQRFNGGQIRIVFLLMLGAVGFVLLIACADVANMMLSRSLARQREMSIRRALGASRWRIVRQLLIESILLSTAGGVVGLGLAAAGVHWFDLVTAKIRPYWVEFAMDYSVFGYLAALCIVSGLLFGIAPALRSSKADLIEVLKEGAQSVSRRSGGWLSSGLVVFQFALTLVLLTGAGIFVRSLFRGLTVNPYIPAAQLTIAGVQLPDTRYKDGAAHESFYDDLLTRLRAIPGVSNAAIASNPPGLDARQQQIELEHELIANPAKRPRVSLLAVSPSYFETIRLPLLRGRGFSEIDGSSHREAAILTRDTAARLWPGQDPVGKRFRLFNDKSEATPWVTVVGVSADMTQEIDAAYPKPIVFVPYRQEDWAGEALLVESANDPTAAMRKAVASLDPELPLAKPSRLKAAIEQRVWFLRVFGEIFLGFALIAMLMASVGIYAVIAHATSSRTQEIGVRIALGATLRNVLMLVMKRGLWQISCGLALGVGAAMPVAHLMTFIPIGGVRSEPAILLAVALTLACVGIFACWLPARRATLLDPVKAIRYQ